jgi:hypothetical protein
MVVRWVHHEMLQLPDDGALAPGRDETVPATAAAQLDPGPLSCPDPAWARTRAWQRRTRPERVRTREESRAPPVPRLVGIELNPGPCRCGGKDTYTTAISCCDTLRCSSCAVAGVACVLACMCHTLGGRTNHICHREGILTPQRPLPTAADEVRRSLDQVVLQRPPDENRFVFRLLPMLSQTDLGEIITKADVYAHVAYVQSVAPGVPPTNMQVLIAMHR